MACRMNAKYSGKCAHCGSGIDVGDPIVYEPECKAAWHVECHEDRMSTEQSPIKPVQEGATARFKKPSTEALEARIAMLEATVKALEQEHAARKSERDELFQCLKRTYFRMRNEGRMNMNIDAMIGDLIKTGNKTMGEGWTA